MTTRAARPEGLTRLLPALAGGAVLLLWASAFIAIRGVGDALSPGPLALGRLAVGTVVLTAFVATRRLRRRHPEGSGPPVRAGRGGLVMVAVYGVLWFAAYTVALNAAERHLDAGTAAMLVNIGPLLVAAAAGVLLREGFSRPLTLGLVVGFVGVVVIAVGGVGGHSDGLGILLGVVSAVLYAAGVLTQKVALRSVDAVLATWLGCAVGTLVLLPYAAPLAHELAAASTGAVLATVYLGVFPTAVAFTLWAYALRSTDAGRLATTTLAVPAIVVVLSWAILHEVPTLLGAIGGVIALAGVAVSRMRRVGRAAAPADTPAEPDVSASAPAATAR